MRDISIVHLNKRCFYPLSLPSGTWSIATIEVALRAGNGIHRPTIIGELYSSHDKEKEQWLLLCIVQ